MKLRRLITGPIFLLLLLIVTLWCEWRRWTTESDRLTCGYIFDSDLFPEVTFENSPMEVELKLIEK